MCLIVNKIDEKKKTKEIVAWKVLCWDTQTDKWVTPYRNTPVNSKKLKANGSKYKMFIGSRLHGGGIHCYLTEAKAKSQLPFFARGCIFKVIGKEYIAEDTVRKHIAFEEITFVDNPKDWEYDYSK